MAESESHKRAKDKSAGKKGQTEVPLPRSRRLDALTSDLSKAIEVERSPDRAQLEKAVRRLGVAEAPKKVLKVPQPHMDTAAAAMRAAGVSGKVENIKGTKSRQVRAPKK